MQIDKIIFQGCYLGYGYSFVALCIEFHLILLAAACLSFSQLYRLFSQKMSYTEQIPKLAMMYETQNKSGCWLLLDSDWVMTSIFYQ